MNLSILCYLCLTVASANAIASELDQFAVDENGIAFRYFDGRLLEFNLSAGSSSTIAMDRGRFLSATGNLALVETLPCRLTAIELPNLKEKWSDLSDPHPANCISEIANAGDVIVYGFRNRVRSLDSATGRRLWEVIGEAFAHEGQRTIVLHKRRLMILDTHSGMLLGSVSLNFRPSVASSRPSVVAQRGVAFVTMGSELAAIHLPSARELWAIKSNGYPITMHLTALGDLVMVRQIREGCYQLARVDAASGGATWTISTPIRLGVMVAVGNVILAAFTEPAVGPIGRTWIIAIDAARGEVLWIRLRGPTGPRVEGRTIPDRFGPAEPLGFELALWSSGESLWVIDARSGTGRPVSRRSWEEWAEWAPVGLSELEHILSKEWRTPCARTSSTSSRSPLSDDMVLFQLLDDCRARLRFRESGPPANSGHAPNSR